MPICTIFAGGIHLFLNCDCGPNKIIPTVTYWPPAHFGLFWFKTTSFNVEKQLQTKFTCWMKEILNLFEAESSLLIEEIHLRVFGNLCLK